MKLQGRSRKRMPIMHFTRANAISRQIFTQETIVFLSDAAGTRATMQKRFDRHGRYDIKACVAPGGVDGE